MNVLFTYAVPGPLLQALWMRNVLMVPDFWEKPLSQRWQALRRYRPDAIVIKDDIPLTRVRDTVEGGGPAILYTHRRRANGARPHTTPAVHDIEAPGGEPLELVALVHAEKLSQRNLPVWRSTRKRSPNETVLLVGAGVVNLMTAVRLRRSGFRVSIVDAAPDPRVTNDRSLFGCTLGGEDGRIFSYTESRQHHFKGDALASVDNQQYRRSVNEGGWLCSSRDSLSSDAMHWIRSYESGAQWLFRIYHRDIVAFNAESFVEFQALRRKVPELFEEVGFIDRLVRTCATPERLAQARSEEVALGSFIRDLSRQQLADELPLLARGLESGAILGALEVKGFSLNVHRFVRKVIAYLERHGVQFRWNTAVTGIARSGGSAVQGVLVQSELVAADHIVISPGVPRSGVLRGTSAHKQLGAMIGMWLTLPCLEHTLTYPIKVGRRGYASDESTPGANLIPGTAPGGQPVVYVSAGHGYLGMDPHHISEQHIKGLERAVHETCKDILPDCYQAAVASGLTDLPPRYCVRPWTPTCLGIFETAPLEGGGCLVITGGHNTGGFAQSPAIAAAVEKALLGQAHPMHQLFHPRRLSNFLDDGTHDVGEANPLAARAAET